MYFFSGDVVWVEKFFDLDFDFFYSGVVFFIKVMEVYEVVKVIFLEWMMVEMDVFYLILVLYWGK